MTGKFRSEKLIMTALMTALIAVMTIAVAIPVPFTNGYIHPGDSMIFLAVLILGWKYGALAGGLGSAFADLILGYVHWAPWTFVIKGGMALIVGFIIMKGLENRKNLIYACIGIGVMWIGFHFAVQGIISFEETHNASALINASGVSEASAFGDFLGNIQAQLMVFALMIPIALALISLWIKKRDKTSIPVEQLIGMTAGGLWMVFGYYIAGGLIYGNFAVSAFSIPANIIQFIGGFGIAVLVSAALYRTPARKYFAYAVSQRAK